MFLSQSCSVFVSCDISTVTVLIRGSRELPCCNLCLHSKRTFTIPSSCVALSLDSHTEAADPSSQRQDTGEGMSTPPGQALGGWHGKGKYVSAVRGHHQRQGRDHWYQQVDPEETGDRRGGSVIPTGQWNDARSWIWCRTRSTKPRDCWRTLMWRYKHPEGDKRWRKCP